MGNETKFQRFFLIFFRVSATQFFLEISVQNQG